MICPRTYVRGGALRRASYDMILTYYGSGAGSGRVIFSMLVPGCGRFQLTNLMVYN